MKKGSITGNFFADVALWIIVLILGITAIVFFLKQIIG